MNITINGTRTDVPDNIDNIEKLINWKHLPEQGTAVAIGFKIIKRDNWGLTSIEPFENITIISAAFGG